MNSIVRLLVLCLFVIFSAAGHADEPSTGARRFYAAVFGIVFAENGDVKQLRLLKVVDPRKGNADAEGVEIPQTFVDAVHKMLSSPKYRPKAGAVPADETYTYFFYDPSRPDRADLDPRPRGR